MGDTGLRGITTTLRGGWWGGGQLPGVYPLALHPAQRATKVTKRGRRRHQSAPHALPAHTPGDQAETVGCDEVVEAEHPIHERKQALLERVKEDAACTLYGAAGPVRPGGGCAAEVGTVSLSHAHAR